MAGKIIQTFKPDGRIHSDVNTENVKELCEFHHTLQMESIQDSANYSWVSSEWSVIPGGTEPYQIFGGLPDGISLSGNGLTADISGILTPLNQWHPVKDYLSANPDEDIKIDGTNYYQKGSHKWYADMLPPLECRFTVSVTETATNNDTGKDETFTYTADCYIVVIVNLDPEAFLVDYGMQNNNLVLPYDDNGKTKTAITDPNIYIREMKSQGHLNADCCN